MGRIPRINVHIEDALFFVTSQGDNVGEIFKDDKDYKTYEGSLDKYRDQYGFKLFSYVLMPERLHLLIELPEDVTISQVMHAINSFYIKYFNNRHDRKGHLLKERFDLIVVEKKSNLLPLSAYIHLSPCRHGLVKVPQDYAYSSYRYCIEGTSQNEGRELIELLSQTKDCKRYEDFIEHIQGEEMEIFGKNLNKTKILGPQEFKKRVKEQVAMQIEQQAKAQNPEMNKKLVLIGVLAVFVFGVVAASLYIVNLGLKDEYQSAIQMKEKESEKNIKVAKEEVRKGLQERYEADMVSFEAMSKRLEREQKK